MLVPCKHHDPHRLMTAEQPPKELIAWCRVCGALRINEQWMTPRGHARATLDAAYARLRSALRQVKARS
jgi:NMD protein affecting ribosome stability and mRNA decay